MLDAMAPTPSHRSIISISITAHNAVTTSFVRERLIGLVEMASARDSLYRAECVAFADFPPRSIGNDWQAGASVQLDHPDDNTVRQVADALRLLIEVTHAGQENTWTGTRLETDVVHGMTGDALAPSTVDGRARMNLPLKK